MQDVPNMEKLETKKDKAKRLFVTPPLFVIFGIHLPVFVLHTHIFFPKNNINELYVIITHYFNVFLSFIMVHVYIYKLEA